jgi:hypothetical protein
MTDPAKLDMAVQAIGNLPGTTGQQQGQGGSTGQGQGGSTGSGVRPPTAGTGGPPR